MICGGDVKVICSLFCLFIRQKRRRQTTFNLMIFAHLVKIFVINLFGYSKEKKVTPNRVSEESKDCSFQHVSFWRWPVNNTIETWRKCMMTGTYITATIDSHFLSHSFSCLSFLALNLVLYHSKSSKFAHSFDSKWICLFAVGNCLCWMLIHTNAWIQTKPEWRFSSANCWVCTTIDQLHFGLIEAEKLVRKNTHFIKR